MNYIDCSDDIRSYHDDDVKLSEETRKKLRGHRNANRDRLKENLKEKKKPAPLRFQKQGSYAMRTTIQHPANDYDIDDGVVFAKADFKGERGAEMSALDARKMVGKALEDDRFSKQPEVLKNCVRVYYNEGYYVDVPVYRESGAEGAEVREIASADWRESDPAAINDWFEKRVAARKSSDDDADTQLRRLVRLLKRYATSRESWNLPSGFILTILTDESYSYFDQREDRAFYNLIVAIRSRLRTNLVVRNPVQDEILTKEDPDPKMVALRDRLGEAITTLEVLNDPKVTRREALKAWAKVFNTDHFDDEIEGDDGDTEAMSVVVGASTPAAAVHKEGGGRFG
ncbi:MAG: hypothetical protein HZA32_16870 [Opitutae bacterium]|nr:hypothetical protein [Opitutae bacterium]